MIDLAALNDAIQAEGRVARIVIAAHKGSTPRETGTSMLVHDGGIRGTIGGGRLEYEAIVAARAMLADGPATRVLRQALGPALGQCCGGSVTLVTEIWDAARYRNEVEAATSEFAGIFARRVEGNEPMPDRLRRRLAGAAERSGDVPTQLSHGWLIEQVWQDSLPVYIYGAGHVGAALLGVLAPLPEFTVHVADARQDLLDSLPGKQRFAAAVPHEEMAQAPDNAAHFIMTPEHDYDLELCHHLLNRRFAYGGLIGSATKWTRFRRRLAALGHDAATIDQIECPIGDPALGKHPQAIAIGIAAKLLATKRALVAQEDVA